MMSINRAPRHRLTMMTFDSANIRIIFVMQNRSGVYLLRFCVLPIYIIKSPLLLFLI